MVLLIGIVSCGFLFFFNPSDINWFPKCPFYALTGYKCPGCGTLRGIHHLLHFRFVDAWKMNPFMIVSIPVLFSFLLFPRICKNKIVGKCVLWVTLLYWLLRNIV